MAYLGVKPAAITSATEAEIAGDLTVDTNTLKVDAANNRVGVGVASPNNPLEIAHTGSAGAGGLRIGDPDTISSDTGIYLRTTGDAVIGAAGGDIVFDTNMAVQERFRITDNGVTFNGDTAAANALDDYEKGTFTPSFTSDGTNPTVSYSFQRGYYTKVGRTVYFQLQLGTNSVSVGSGSLFISGLPFTANASLESRSGAVGLHYTWATGIPDAKWVLFANDNKLYLYAGDNAGNTIPTSYLDTGSSKNRIWIQGFYDV